MISRMLNNIIYYNKSAFWQNIIKAMLIQQSIVIGNKIRMENIWLRIIYTPNFAHIFPQNHH